MGGTLSLPIYLRPVTREDGPFLYEIFKESRISELGLLQLPEEQFEALMRMQYQLREQTYRAQFPDADHSIVSWEHTNVGQLRVNRTAREHRLVDIELVPDQQARGIGTHLVNTLIAAAKQAGVPLRCSVAKNNHGSLRFHQRLGFTVVSEDPMYFQLERRPD